MKQNLLETVKTFVSNPTVLKVGGVVLGAAVAVGAVALGVARFAKEEEEIQEGDVIDAEFVQPLAE